MIYIGTFIEILDYPKSLQTFDCKECKKCNITVYEGLANYCSRCGDKLEYRIEMAEIDIPYEIEDHFIERKNILFPKHYSNCYSIDIWIDTCDITSSFKISNLPIDDNNLMFKEKYQTQIELLQSMGFKFNIKFGICQSH